MAGSGRKREKGKNEAKERAEEKEREGITVYVWQGIDIVTDGPDRRLGRALAGCDWPGLEIQWGARSRELCVGPISTEWPHSCVAGPNLDAARG